MFTQFVQVIALKLGGILLVAVAHFEPDVKVTAPRQRKPTGAEEGASTSAVAVGKETEQK